MPGPRPDDLDISPHTMELLLQLDALTAKLETMVMTLEDTLGEEDRNVEQPG